MTKIGLTQFLVLILISAAYGQKVKYKDIYALLSTKQFEQAEPFLKRYLKETTDNPNAYLFMGNIFQEKSSANDILKQTDLAIANMDSAIYFYDRAYKTIDDREVRKNKEYYQHYSRRDLRTGDFGVKLSDIQFDIEKRMQALKEKIDKVRMTKHFFSLADSAYQRANAQFVGLQRQYASLNQLYLRADNETVKALTTLSLRYDSCVKAFDAYKGALSGLPKTGYDQKLSVTAISDFKLDGRSGADFLAEEVKLWDYKKFADAARTVIEKEIMPMREHLVAYDTEINKLRDKLSRDSVSVRSDLTGLIDRLLYDQLKKYDLHPLPMVIFGLKTTDLEYRSLLIEHKPFRDSADLHFQVALLGEELALLKAMDSTATLIPEGTLEEKALDYAAFVNAAYGDLARLTDYINSQREYAFQENEKKSRRLARYVEGLNYIVDGADSIPLSPDVVSPYRALATTPEKFTVGLSLKDSTKLEGYFYTITASRQPEVKAHFPVDKTGFTPANLSNARAIASSDPGDQIFYVLLYSDSPVKDKFPATLAKIYRSDGLAWKGDYPLNFVPSELVLAADTGELIISNGEQQLVVDKNGKVVKN